METELGDINKVAKVVKNKSSMGKLSCGIKLLHDNARSHNEVDTTFSVTKFGWSVISHSLRPLSSSKQFPSVSAA